MLWRSYTIVKFFIKKLLTSSCYINSRFELFNRQDTKILVMFRLYFANSLHCSVGWRRQQKGQNSYVFFIHLRRQSRAGPRSGFLNPADLLCFVSCRCQKMASWWVCTFRYFLLTSVDNVIWPAWQAGNRQASMLQLCSSCLFLTCLFLRSCKLRNSLVGRKILYTNMNVDAKKLSVLIYLG